MRLTVAKPTAYPRDPRTLREHLKKRRCELGLFQREAALGLGVNESTYLRWENDKSHPAPSQLPRVIHFLGYDPNPYRKPEKITWKA